MKLMSLLLGSVSLLGCIDNDGDGDATPLQGPDDGRSPELGTNPGIVTSSKISMVQGIAQAEATGPVIEAKFELGDDGKLSLSTYPVGAPLAYDSERSTFQELAGDPTSASWAPVLEQFHDFEHLTRSSRDLTLVQLSATGVKDAAARVSGFVYWSIPTIHAGHAGYGVFSYASGKSSYTFLDGGGDRTAQVLDLGASPGTGASDARTPELNNDPTIVRQSKITMSQALAQVEAAYGKAIEAKFEIGDDGALSLSVYPASDVTKPAEANTLSEASGDPTAASWAPTLDKFDVPDEEHLTRAARDLTLVQVASLTLRDAVAKAEAKFPGGIVYWAIPTRRGTTAGYGIYVLDSANVSHYLFVS